MGKQLSLSTDGSFCACGAANGNKYFYLIEIETKKQYKLTSKVLGDTFTPCFINGNTGHIALGDYKGNIEIWDISTKEAIRNFKASETYITCTTSTNNILAIGSGDGKMRLYDVRSWKMFHSEKYEMQPFSLNLTADFKYLIIGGYQGEKCVVLNIQ